MFKNLLKNSLCAGALLAAGVSHQAMAATVDISGTLFWGVGTPLTAYSAPGAESAFAFDLTTPTGVAAGDPVSVTNYSYSLNNVAVLGPTPTVSFYPTSEKGLFNINYGDFRVSLYGADIGSTRWWRGLGVGSHERRRSANGQWRGFGLGFSRSAACLPADVLGGPARARRCWYEGAPQARCLISRSSHNGMVGGRLGKPGWPFLLVICCYYRMDAPRGGPEDLRHGGTPRPVRKADTA